MSPSIPHGTVGQEKNAGHKLEKESTFPLAHHVCQKEFRLFPCLRPHHAIVSLPASGSTSTSTSIGKEDQAATFNFNARDHRKGRHTRLDASKPRERRITWLNFDYGNISWWVGMMFTLGSVVWVINGFFDFLPEIYINTMTANTDAIGWTAWVGATIFFFGAYAGLLEAINRGSELELGNAVYDALHQHQHEQQEKRQTSSSNDTLVVPKPSTNPHSSRIGIQKRQQHVFLHSAEKAARTDSSGKAQWAWTGTRFNELGYDLLLIQMAGATIFWIPCFAGLPGVLSSMSSPLAIGLYWSLQVVGGTCFVVSAFGFMIESQTCWWRIEPFKLGWHVGFWNLVGGIGFTLCGGLGTNSSSGAQYQSACSTFWASFAFLIGSYCQWFEAMNPETIKV